MGPIPGEVNCVILGWYFARVYCDVGFVHMREKACVDVSVLAAGKIIRIRIIRIRIILIRSGVDGRAVRADNEVESRHDGKVPATYTERVVVRNHATHDTPGQ